MSIIFAKILAFKRVTHNVLLNFDITKFVLYRFAFFPLYSNCAIESKFLYFRKTIVLVLRYKIFRQGHFTNVCNLLSCYHDGRILIC